MHTGLRARASVSCETEARTVASAYQNKVGTMFNKINMFTFNPSYHFSLFLTVSLLFKCRFVA